MRLNFELVLDDRTLHLIRDLNVNLPQLAIEGILAGLEREQSVRHVVQVASTQETIAQLSAALTRMREQRDEAIQSVGRRERTMLTKFI
jgi:hypothetical protein